MIVLSSTPLCLDRTGQFPQLSGTTAVPIESPGALRRKEEIILRVRTHVTPPPLEDYVFEYGRTNKVQRRRRQQQPRRRPLCGRFVVRFSGRTRTPMDCRGPRTGECETKSIMRIAYRYTYLVFHCCRGEIGFVRVRQDAR